MPKKEKKKLICVDWTDGKGRQKRTFHVVSASLKVQNSQDFCTIAKPILTSHRNARVRIAYDVTSDPKQVRWYQALEFVASMNPDLEKLLESLGCADIVSDFPIIR